MATGGDDTAIVDQDEDPPVETKQLGAEEDESGWLDNDDKDQQQGVGRPRKQSKRNAGAAGILRIDTTAATAAGFNSRRKSSASSVGDFRSGATYLNPQADEKSPLPSADRLSVSFIMGERADASSVGSGRMDSPLSAIHHHHLSNNQPQHYLDIDDEYDDDEYSIAASSILQQQQRRRSGPGGGGGRSSLNRRTRSFRRGGRRPSSPFPGDELSMGGRRRTSRGFSVATISSAEIGMDETGGGFYDQQQQQREVAESAAAALEHVALHKEVVQNMRYQPWDMGRKLRVLRRAKSFVRQHEGALQQRLAESRTAKDVFARGRLLLAKAVQLSVREIRNLISFLVPWEARIKEIESLFGSAVASYFTFLRWVFWINLVLTACFAVFVVVPEVLATEWDVSGERKGLLPEEKRTATDLQTLWDFEGILKYSPIFYGFYSNAYETNEGYKLPFAYFFTGLVLYMYSFVAILRKMAKNSRMAKLSDKDDECTFTWKLFTGWDFMIGHPETGENRRSAITLGFKEALLEEAEKERATEKLTRNVICRRLAANFLVLMLLCSSAYIVVLVVERSTEPEAESNWWRQNEITVILSLISIIFPNIFELIGILEKYHPRRQLRWQLARIMILNLLNLYTLIFALFGKVNAMTTRLAVMKANISQQGLNLADLLLDQTSSSMTTPIFNATWESSAYYNVTDPILFILNATESPGPILLDNYSSTSTQPAVTDEEDVDLTGTCFQIMVDCSALETTTDPPPVRTTTAGPAISEEDELIYDEEDYETVPERLKRQLLLDQTTANPLRTTPQSIGRLLDSLNSILRNLKRNTTLRPIPYTSTLPFSTSSSSTESGGPSTTTSPATADRMMESTASSTPELLDDLIRWHTAGLILTTEEDDYDELADNSSSASIFEAFNQTNPADDFIVNQDNETITTTQLPEEMTTTVRLTMCPLVVCPWNDTVGYFSSLTTTNLPSSDGGGDESNGTTLPCRGDNPQGCTPFWTSSRDETITSFHSSISASSTPSSNEEEMAAMSKKTRPTLDPATRLELRKLCWETMFGQELVKLTIMDLIFTTISILIIDFIRAIFVRVFNGCWCWDLEKYFPQYGEFKIAENILHLVNNQGMVWMGMFFSPGLPAINIFKLFLLLYIRSWAVLTCNVPHEVIFKASRSNNFYLWLLLIMLFLCTLPVAYAIVWLEPSWHCGPFSEYSRIFHVMTQSLLKATPDSLHWVLSYVASPGVVIPLLVLLILVIYYLVSLSSSLREAVTDLRTQLRRERDAERLKTRQKKEAESVAAVPDAAAAKVIAQWRKAVPFAPTKSQTILPQTLAKEAVDKRGGGGMKDGLLLHQRAGASAGASAGAQPRTAAPVGMTTGRQVGLRRGQQLPPVKGSRGVTAAATTTEFDGASDLDISDSLPHDSPVLNGRAAGHHQPPLPGAAVPASPPHHQPVYASVVKKKKKPNNNINSPPRVDQQLASHQPDQQEPLNKMTDAPRSPAKIPLIRISQTESVERAERNPPTPMTDPPSLEDGTTTGLVATSPTKIQHGGGALNLILQRAKERRALAIKQQPITVSESTADLVLNMEETARRADTPDHEKMDETLDSISDETPTVTENQQ
ncbi:transmembrane channel-like protein [Daphnia pulex]|uniref:transmembrane channel-like protein n=1 Tax=Daphnia pulex TaxID=6669 RepID=UPI001EDCBE7A|nr:transmembrane channel-like protein [Daphnia pulex]